jgi:hypothetical protein
LLKLAQRQTNLGQCQHLAELTIATAAALATLNTATKVNTMKVIVRYSVPYLVCTPAKSLFSSTLIHEVVNRGDLFAVNLLDGTLTVLPGTISAPEPVLAELAEIRKQLVDLRAAKGLK